MRLDLPLATLDASLTKAAKKSKVPAFEPFRARCVHKSERRPAGSSCLTGARRGTRAGWTTTPFF
jgi:hypothetical protein